MYEINVRLNEKVNLDMLSQIKHWVRKEVFPEIHLRNDKNRQEKHEYLFSVIYIKMNIGQTNMTVILVQKSISYDVHTSTDAWNAFFATV